MALSPALEVISPDDIEETPPSAAPKKRLKARKLTAAAEATEAEAAAAEAAAEAAESSPAVVLPAAATSGREDGGPEGEDGGERENLRRPGELQEEEREGERRGARDERWEEKEGAGEVKEEGEEEEEEEEGYGEENEDGEGDGESATLTDTDTEELAPVPPAAEEGRQQQQQQPPGQQHQERQRGTPAAERAQVKTAVAFSAIDAYAVGTTAGVLLSLVVCLSQRACVFVCRVFFSFFVVLPLQAALTTVEIRIHTKPKIVRPDM